MPLFCLNVPLRPSFADWLSEHEIRALEHCVQVFQHVRQPHLDAWNRHHLHRLFQRSFGVLISRTFCCRLAGGGLTGWCRPDRRKIPENGSLSILFTKTDHLLMKTTGMEIRFTIWRKFTKRGFTKEDTLLYVNSRAGRANRSLRSRA